MMKVKLITCLIVSVTLFFCLGACCNEELLAVETVATTSPDFSTTSRWELYTSEITPTVNIYDISYVEVAVNYYDESVRDISRFSKIKELVALSAGISLASEKERREYANTMLINLDAAGYKHKNPTHIIYYEIGDVAVYCFEDLVLQSHNGDRPTNDQATLDGGTMYIAVDCKTGSILHIGYGFS